MTPDELRSLADEATPGPWKAESRSSTEDGELIVVGFGGYLLWGYDDEFENQADARIIALAPDLARLCAELPWGLLTHIGECGDHPDHLMEAENACRAALTKLSGLEAR